MLPTNDERRIILIGGLILTILTLTAGISVFNIMQRQTESILSMGLEVALQKKIRLFEHQIEQGLLDTRTASKRLLLIQNLELIQTPSSKREGLAGLKQTANELLQANLTSIVIYDNQANKVMNAGRTAQHPALTVRLETNSDISAFLLWDKQFFLRTVKNILNQENQPFGSITLEQSLPALTQTFTKASLIGETGDFMLCAPLKENNLEMDCFLRGVGGNEFKRVHRIMSNEPLPMHYALEGQRGIQFAKDYRQVPVVAAHSPMAYGLGTVLKIDEKELYYPITKQIKIISLYLAAFILGGVLMLYWLMMPLVRKLIISKQETLKANNELQNAKEKAEQVSTELSAYIGAIDQLTPISATDTNGNILQANNKFCVASGYSEEELLGHNHRIISSKIHPKAFYVKMWSTIARGETWHGEICNRRKDGTLYWVDSTIVPLKDNNGRIIRYLSVKVDITARKQKDMALKERLRKSACLQAVRHEMELDLTRDELCQRILDHLIPAMQCPDIAAASIELNGKRYIAGKYDKKLTHKLTTTITINNKIHGQLQVAHTNNKAFFPEEQTLLDTIGNDLARWIERKQDVKIMIDMATLDSLTGLPNRRLLQDRLKQVLAHDHRTQTQMAILFIDLDHFKIINDSLGHDIGDLLLKEVAARITSCVREEDTVARQGGDEFIAVLNSITQTPDAGIVAQKILDKISQPYQIQNEELHIGASIGIAVFPDDGTDARTLLKNSDVAMYHAKAAGRNNYQFFTAKMNQLAAEKHTLGNELRHALERNELKLYFQPVVNMPGLKLESIEVLLRWQHPKHGLISPIKFIALAEESGLIMPIGKWVLKTACLQIKKWRELGYQIPRLAINLSARQFWDETLIDNITQTLNETGVEARFLSLEITESMIVDNVDKVIQTLDQLNQMGLEIAIDDFGTGYSSLSYLKRFPIKTLKIDHEFIKDIMTDPSDNAIVSAIIAMAKSLEISVIAEGVESRDQLNLLMKHGCDSFQGYYFSKTLPASEIENSLS